MYRKINRTSILHIVCLGLILFLSLLSWNKLGIITIVDDEFGYWGNAAQMAGLQWDSLLAESAYYSYGYSILLVPLFWLEVEATIKYKIAVLLNIVLLLGSFELAVHAGKILFAAQKKWTLFLAALMVTLFSNNIFQVYIGAPEALLYFLFWCVLVSLLHVLQKQRKRDIIFLVLSTVYSYAVHNRSIGVVVVVAVVMLGLTIKFRKERYGKYLLGGLVFLFLLFACAEIAREFVINHWYQNNQSVAVNDYSGQVVKLLSIFSLKGMVIFGLSLAGKLFSQGVGSFLYSFLIFTWCLKLVFQKWKEKCFHCSWEDYIVLFLALCYLAEIAINAIHKNATPRSMTAGRIMMGRYTDFVIGPILLVGICRLIDRAVERWEIVTCCVAFAGCTLLTGFAVRMSSSESIIYFNNMDIAFGVEHLPGGMPGILLMGGIAILGFLVGYCVFYCWKSKTGIAWIVAVGCFWGLTAAVTAGNYSEYKKDKANMYLYPVRELFENYGADISAVYVRSQEDDITKMEYLKLLQFWNPQLDISVVALEDFDVQTYSGRSCFILSGVAESTVERLSEETRLFLNTERLCVYTVDKQGGLENK